MKLYMKTRNKFFKISIFILLIAVALIFIFHLNTLGYFLLGIFASTLIITLQYDIAADVEESEILTDKLKEISSSLHSVKFMSEQSLEGYAKYYGYEESFKEYRTDLEKIFTLRNEIASLKYLETDTKKAVDFIIDSINELESKLYIILEKFDESNEKVKIIYFIETYKIINESNIPFLVDKIFDLGYEIGYDEFYQNNFIHERQRNLEDLKRATSISVYNKKIEEKNSIEYSTLKDDFKRGEAEAKEMRKNHK